MAEMRRASENDHRRNHFRAVWTVSIFLLMAALFIVTLSRIGFKRMENVSISHNLHESWTFLPEHDHPHVTDAGFKDLIFHEPLISRLNVNNEAEFTTRSNIETIPNGAKRRLLGVSEELKKKALKGLEKPLLEPPRCALLKSRAFLKKIKYLPDLLHDHTLERYNRRVFVTFGTEEENRSSKQWFYENYPLRNRQSFEVFELESSNIDVSGWLIENVGEEDYVVLKAEAAAVEEMMMVKSGAIRLVDELFLECKNQWGFKERNKSKRAYWECLFLYGRLKDQGVAIHQWWQ